MLHPSTEVGLAYIELSRKVPHCSSRGDPLDYAVLKAVVPKGFCSVCCFDEGAESHRVGLFLAHSVVSPCSRLFFHSNIRSCWSGFAFQNLIQSGPPGLSSWKSSVTGGA